MSSGGGGVIEKARGKVALEDGHSLRHWMRLSNSADLTGGVGAVDQEEDEDSWKEWTLAEVSKHNTPEDAWMVVHGKVYAVTAYLPYHPGGKATLMKAAGTDGTELFDKFHSWVSADGLLEACCVGKLASSPPPSTPPPSPPPSPPPASPSLVDGIFIFPSQCTAAAIDAGTPVKIEDRPQRIRWDEEGIRAHDAERGVLFGTMKVEHLETPYLYLDDAEPVEGELCAAIHPKYLPTHVPHASGEPTAPGPYSMPVADLRNALGLLETDEEGLVNLPRPKWAHADEFGMQRQEMYRSEAEVDALSRGLPGTPAHTARCCRAEESSGT